MSDQLLHQILTELKDIKTEQHRSNERMDKMTADIADIKQDVAELKSDVSLLKSDVAELKSDVSLLKSDMIGVKVDISELKVEQKTTNLRLASIEKDTSLLPFIQQAVLETNGIVKQLETGAKASKTELQNHEYSIDLVSRRQFRLEVEVEKLKNR